MAHLSQAELVADFPLANLKLFSLGNASPCRYRFVDVKKCSNESQSRLSILSFTRLPAQPYAAVSHVWKGLGSIDLDGQAFEVDGIEKQPKIPVDTLKTLCTVASKFDCTLLWLDKLCSRQDSESSTDGKKDNKWQVQHMHEIYRSCTMCLVLPGGLNRLAALNEKTNWIERAWTLQEALAPPVVRVIIDWNKGDAILQHNAFVRVQEVVPGKVGAIELKGLLEASLKSKVKLMLEDPTNRNRRSSPTQSLRIVGSGNRSEMYPIMALLGALDHSDEEGRPNAIWRCTMLRSAKFAVDMIYSIMGLLNTSIPVDYAKDPTAVVIEFTQALTAKGQRADWLGIAPGLGPFLHMSAMPVLPFSSDNLGAFVEVAPRKLAAVKTLLGQSQESMWWWLKDAPRGKVDSDGSFTFSALSVSVAKSRRNAEELRPLFEGYAAQREYPNTLVQCSGDQAWDILPAGMGHVGDGDGYAAVIVGKKEWYTSGIFSAVVVPDRTLVMIVERKESGWRGIGYAWGDEELGAGWGLREFRIGG